jgi:DNA polymerase-3 subunit gamma/tau
LASADASAEAPLALYRRYRPESFAEVIGQEHVTEPLRHALAGNRVNHAYLFSGPRGCGKTTSARILARALNCEKAPIADPCGECQSCRDLARGGPGSIDVIEMDAASHGNVEEARDLRERAFFAPVSSRYKVYIIDEAHMVSNAAFNALLKLVEEPPPHVRFIFATTEPNKVIGTIRSRTHHYPFRLVPPKLLGDYLMNLCQQEGVTLEPTALPLVVRAGAGSVRDTLSILDQLFGGAGPDGVTYDLAVQLLGYTPDALLDESIEAFAAHDGGTVFRAIDKVIESGQDPRRFAEDLLQRLRDLVIVKAVPDALTTGLIDAPDDLAERLVKQAGSFGGSDLTRNADIVNEALVEFRGATAPRLLLELMGARMLVPTADATDGGLAARLDRLERRIGIEGAAPAAPASVAAPAPVAVDPPAPAPVPEAEPDPEPGPDPAPTVEAAEVEAEPAPAQEPRPDPEPEPAPTVAEPVSSPTGNLSIADVRRTWPTVLDRVKDVRRFTWMVLDGSQSKLIGLDGDTLTVGLVNAGARDSFLASGSVEVLTAALHDVLGVSWRVDVIVDPSASGPDASGATPAPAAPAKPRGRSVPESVRQAAESVPGAEVDDPDAAAHPDDPVVEADLDPEQLLANELGARVIDEKS